MTSQPLQARQVQHSEPTKTSGEIEDSLDLPASESSPPAGVISAPATDSAPVSHLITRHPFTTTLTAPSSEQYTTQPSFAFRQPSFRSRAITKLMSFVPKLKRSDSSMKTESDSQFSRGVTPRLLHDTADSTYEQSEPRRLESTSLHNNNKAVSSPNAPNPFQRGPQRNSRAHDDTRIQMKRRERARSLSSTGTTSCEPTSSSASSDASYPGLTEALQESQISHEFPVLPSTQDDPIDIDSWSESESNSLYDADAEKAPTNAPRTCQDYTDDLLARQLQEEEDRALQDYRDGVVARRLQQEEDCAQHAVVKTRECAVCGDESPIAALPSLAECEHMPQTCGPCYAGWVTAQLQASGWTEAKCPESKCDIKLGYYDIQHIVSEDTFEQYDTYIARAVVSEDPSFRWCRACNSGQVHVSGEEGNIFTCADCGHKVCIVHESTWHEGETCEEYEYRSSGRQERDRKAQEAASVDFIGKLSKKCPGPNCLYNIEKNDGCDHMTCSRCRYEFCWICLCDYNEIRRKGNSAHARECQYHSGRLH